METEPKIIYKKDDCVVVYKPQGWLTVGRDTGKLSLENWLLENVIESRELYRAGIVHRLDRETSGGVLVALSEAAAVWYSSQFKQRAVEKYYWCFVSGKSSGWGKIEMPIGMWRGKGVVKRKVKIDGKMAITEFWREAIGRKDGLTYSWLKVRIYTGRTHQIRVHLNYLGWPIVGDRWYGKTKEARLMLHEGFLGVSSKDGGRVAVEIPIPLNMREILKQYEIET
ncbi:MAG: RNA pseudouridine synthase [Candidatus Shapirobacteria bacterium]